MSELYQRAGALADEIAAMNDLAYHGDDPELRGEMRDLDRISRSRKTLVTRSRWDELDETLRREVTPQVAALIQADRESFFQEKVAEIRHEAESRARVAIRPRLIAIAAREERSKPSYRARFAVLGGVVALSADVLIRAVA